MRKHFDLHPEEAFLIEIEDERGHTTFVEFRDAAEFAVIGNPYANIEESVRRVHGRFFRLTIVGEEDQNSARGIQKGWYIARWISNEDANKLRHSWEVLREQPSRNYLA
jgi:hypothetical protein